MTLSPAEISAVKASGPATHRLDVVTLRYDSHGALLHQSTTWRPAWFITSTPAGERARFFYMDDSGELLYTYEPLPDLNAQDYITREERR